MIGVGASRSPWPATALVAIASFCGLWALDATVLLAPWMRTTGFILALAAAATMAARATLRSRFLPTVVGAVVTLLALIPAYAVDDDGNRLWLPTPGGITGLVDAVNGGLAYAQTTTAPAVVERPLAALLTVAMIGMFLLADAIAVSLRLVAVSGLVIFLPWLAPVVIAQRVPLLPLILALVCWVATMALAKRGIAAQRSAPWPAATAAVVAFAAIVAIAAPASLSGPGWGLIPRTDLPEELDAGATRLNLALDLRNSLTTNSQTAVLYYLSSGDKPDAFRLYTFTDFNGSSWSREDTEISPRPASGGVLWPETVDDWAGSSRTRLDIVMLSLIERNLPLPNGPRTLDVEGPWFYDAATDEVTGDAITTSDLQYVVVADLDYHSARELREASPSIAAGQLDPTAANYYDIAPAIDLTRVTTLSDALTADATNRYDAVLAIQSFLRNPREFTYDTAVAPTGADSVSEFLDSRSGYCVQFATTMVTMLRSQGIPARMAVGFLPGTRDGDGYVVEGGDAHAWPEVYFPGRGWVRFEPTPSVQTGAPPAWADPFFGQVPVPREVLEGGAFPTPPEVGEGRPTVLPVDPGVTEEDPAPLVPWWAVAIMVALAVAAVAVAWWRWRGGLEARSERHTGVEGAWRRLARELGDLAWPTASTPVEAGRHVLTGLTRVKGAPPTDGSVEAVRALVGAIVTRRYLPQHAEVSQEQADAWTDAILAEARQARAESAGRR